MNTTSTGDPIDLGGFSPGSMRALGCDVKNEAAYFGPNVTLCVTEGEIEGKRKMSLLLIIVVLLLLFGGGGGYYAHRNYGGAGLGGVLGLVLIIIVVLYLFGGMHA